MGIKEYILRIIRQFYYWRYRRTGKRYRQLNRALLRTIHEETNPTSSAPVITERRTDDQWKSLEPIWVLSTGRTGTHTLTELFQLSPKVDPYHEPAPELFQLSYDYYMGNIDRPGALSALKYARDERVFRSFRDGLIYIETNNRVTYLADLLLDLYPKSKFLYLYRNPYDFIRSGMRREYYHGHLRDAGRITPRADDKFYKEWQSFSDIEKVAWNWRAVNQLCISFMNKLPQNQQMSFSSESLFSANKELVDQLFDFIGSREYHPPTSAVDRVLDTKYNAQKRGSFSKPSDWTEGQARKVDQLIRPVANQLPYELMYSTNTDQEFHS